MNNDLISRKALKEQISDDDCYSYSGSFLKDLIDNAPTVEPFEPDYVGAERLKARQRGYNEGYHNGMEMEKTLNPKIKQGEWVEKEDTPASVYYCCSNCNMKDIPVTPYCPWCGAEMKGGAE